MLGSHNFMLNSYGLRTMVLFILMNQTTITSPVQTLFAFLNYFASFDFENSIITIFGVIKKEALADYIKAPCDVYASLMEQYYQRNRAACEGQKQ